MVKLAIRPPGFFSGLLTGPVFETLVYRSLSGTYVNKFWPQLLLVKLLRLLVGLATFHQFNPHKFVASKVLLALCPFNAREKIITLVFFPALCIEQAQR